MDEVEFENMLKDIAYAIAKNRACYSINRSNFYFKREVDMLIELN